MNILIVPLRMFLFFEKFIRRPRRGPWQTQNIFKKVKNYRICRFGQGNRDVSFHIFKGKAVLKVVDVTVIFSLAVQACFEDNSYLSILTNFIIYYISIRLIPERKLLKLLKCGFRKKWFIMNAPLVSWAYLSSLWSGFAAPTQWWQICSTD